MSEVKLIFDSGPKAEVRIRRNDIEADVRQELRIVPPTEHYNNTKYKKFN